MTEILSAAADRPREEVCGLLLGDGTAVHSIQPAENVASDPARRFEIDPAVLIAAYKNVRSGGPQMMGHYHSHPGGIAMPSACDAQNADETGLWLIVAGEDVGLFAVTPDGPIRGRFRRVSMRLV